LVADLVSRRVALIAAIGLAMAAEAKAATAEIPIVFNVGADPVQLGLVASLARPGGNLTGVAMLLNVLAPKQLELLHELVPKATRVGILVSPSFPSAEADINDMQQAARALALRLLVLPVRTEGDIDAAFASLVQQQAGGLVVISDPFIYSRREQIIALTERHAVPAIYPTRENLIGRGLASYGTSITDAYRQVGLYAGQVLKGAKPADLPVQQAVKVEMVSNLKTARALGLDVPPTLLARADEVIE
jgi:putative tryptophan/tyrosine transport system substrate-binding protein